MGAIYDGRGRKLVNMMTVVVVDGGGWTVVAEDTPARRDIRKIREKIIKKYKLNVVFTYSVKSPGRMYKKRA